MPRNGSGSYSLPAGNPFIPSTVISSTTMNNTMSDIGTALTQSLSNDGQTTPVANLPMATFRHTNVGNAVARTDYAAAGQVQDSVLMWLTTIAGTDTITASITPSPTAYAAGQTFRFVPAGANTTNAVTLNLNGLGAKNITKNGTEPLSAGDIAGGSMVEVIYDGTQFQILSPGTVQKGSSYIRGLNGANNAGIPGTKVDFSASEVCVRNPTTGTTVTVPSVSTITNDTQVAGPTANGRDQAAAFSTSTWLHFYFIWNGATMATLSSTSATAPVLPTGYTHQAYIGAIYYDGTPTLARVRLRGAWVDYDNPPIAVTSTATVSTAVPLTTMIPPNSLEYRVNVVQLALTSAGSGAYGLTLNLEIVSGTSCFQQGFSGVGGATQVFSISGGFSILPNVAQNFYIRLVLAAGTGPTSTVNMIGYKIPNGGE